MKTNILSFFLAAFLLLTGSGPAIAQSGPASVSAGTITQNSVALSWPTVSGIYGYHIVWKPGASAPANNMDGGYVDVAGSSVSAYTVTGLSNSTQYTFTVYGYDQSIHGVKTFG